ncbi:MAG: hypothetical protein FJX25_04650 [Alphaproteobacteria bacterium]|nr:hypothetical protein [Alphaproteobacteria bacterium]
MNSPWSLALQADLPLVARTQFTREMLENLKVVFEAASEDKPVTVEMRNKGIWAVTFDGTPLLLGPTQGPAPYPR